MKKAYHKIFAGIICLMLVVTLIGCDNNKSTNNTNETSNNHSHITEAEQNNEPLANDNIDPNQQSIGH